jgi:predicted membrane protein
MMKNQMQCILEYIAIALMVLNIVGYALHKSISCVALFGVGAYIARCFSKNLTINIFAGLLVSNVFFGCSSLREGLGLAAIAAGLQSAADVSEKKAKEAKEAKETKEEKETDASQ